MFISMLFEPIFLILSPRRPAMLTSHHKYSHLTILKKDIHHGAAADKAAARNHHD